MLRHKVNGLLTSPAKGVNARVHHQTASSEDLEGIMSVPAEGEILKVSLFVAHLLVIFDRPVARSLSLALPIIFSHLSLLLLHQPTTYLLNTRLQPSFTTTTSIMLFCKVNSYRLVPVVGIPEEAQVEAKTLGIEPPSLEEAGVHGEPGGGLVVVPVFHDPPEEGHAGGFEAVRPLQVVTRVALVQGKGHDLVGRP